MGAALAREAAAIALMLDVGANTRVVEAAEQAQRAVDQLEALATEDDEAAYQAALWAMTSAAVALTEARKALAAQEMRIPIRGASPSALATR